MSTTTLKVIQNNNKLILLNLNKINKALSFSKKDIQLYFSKLSTIINKHSNNKIQSQAWKYLVKQDKLQSILNDLIVRLQSLTIQWKTKTSSNSTSYADMLEEMNQIEREVRIFNEIHYTVKRTYLRFVNEFSFKKDWKNPRKVA